MRNFFSIVSICFLLTNLWGQSISVSPQVVYSVFDSGSDLDGSIGYGINLVSHLSIHFSAAVVYRYVPAQQRFLTPAGENYSSINMHLYGVQFTTPLFHFHPGSGISLNTGAGGSTFKNGARVIDLGALGRRILPAESATYFTFWLGIAAHYMILPALAIHIEPQLVFLDTPMDHYTNYHLAGGLRIEL